MLEEANEVMAHFLLRKDSLSGLRRLQGTGPCARTVEFNLQAPKDVQKLFGDVGEEIKAVSKIINFQGKQKAKFLLKLKNNHGNAKLDKRRYEMKKVKKNKLAKIEEVKRRLSDAKEEIKRKNSMIKLQKAN